jgi:hypothetical protein
MEPTATSCVWPPVLAREKAVEEPAAGRELSAGREALLRFHKLNCVAGPVRVRVFNVRGPVAPMGLKKHKRLT